MIALMISNLCRHWGCWDIQLVDDWARRGRRTPVFQPLLYLVCFSLPLFWFNYISPPRRSQSLRSLLVEGQWQWSQEGPWEQFFCLHCLWTPVSTQAEQTYLKVWLCSQFEFTFEVTVLFTDGCFPSLLKVLYYSQRTSLNKVFINTSTTKLWMTTLP